MPNLSHNDPFFSSKFSIEWAKDHIKEFEGRVDIFFKGDGCTVFTEPDIDRSYQLLKIKVAPMMPRSLLGHATDIIYNLRAALDQAINSVATLNNTPSNRCHFPIFNAEKWVEDALESPKKLKKILPQEIRDLVRGFKPYKGGNDFIWTLNELANTSKHAILSPMPSATANFTVTGAPTGAQAQFFNPPIWDATGKNEMTVAKLPIAAEHTVKSDAACTVGFSNIKYIENSPALWVFGEFLHKVEGIVVAIERESRRIGIITDQPVS